MRQLQKPPKETKPMPRKKPREPLEEGITVPRHTNGGRLWLALTDAQLVEYARRFMQKNSVTSKKELVALDNGLYQALSTRKLLDAFEELAPQYNSYPKGRSKMVKKARKFLQENGITSRKEFEKKHLGFYCVLQRRKLLDAAFEGIKPKRARYPKEPEELVKQARKFIQENRISTKTELIEKNLGWYKALHRRGLLTASFKGIGPNQKVPRKYPKDPEELLRQAKQFIQENRITSRKELQKMAGGFYEALRLRDLLDAAFEGIKPKHREYPKDPRKLVKLARSFIHKNGISRRWELQKKDPGFYEVLRKRKLLDAVFAELEANQQKAAVQEVLDELMEFGGKK